jgi:hemerythrin superfamily protein
VDEEVDVEVPVRTAYNQWTQFEDFPQFMGGVHEVRQLDDTTIHWVAEIAGVRREWDAAILEQVPDEKIAWAAERGATNAGAVFFTPEGPTRTRIHLHLEFEPEGMVDKAADALNLVQRQAVQDLASFKEFIESQPRESGGWRGSVNEDLSVGTPGVEAAQASEGDSGKAGLSGKTAAAGLAGAAAVAAAGVAAAKEAGSGDEQSHVPAAEEDVVDVLTSDHREVIALIADIQTCTNPTERRDLADTLITELVRHSVAEEMYVYPAMRKHLTDGDAAVHHDLEEHKELEVLMKQLEAEDAAGARFTELVSQITATLADHVRDEEAEQFPQLRASVPKAELVEIAQKVETAKKLAPTRPHPAAPNSELFHKVVGPGVGLVDRLRDRLSNRSG